MPTQCENCAAPIEGEFCAQCGQSATDFNLPVGEFAREFASEAFSLDSRLRLTLRPLFLEPGAVPRAYVAGQRARFVPPIRLYVFASFTMFLIMTLGSGLNVDNVNVNTGDGAPSAVDSVTATPERAPSLEPNVESRVEPSVELAPSVEPTDPSERSFEERIQDRFALGLQRIDEDSRSFSRDFLNRLAQAMFFLLPAFAALLKLVHRRRLYIHHLVFAVYLHSFVFLVVAFASFPDAVGLSGVSEWMGIAVFTIPPYLLLGMKRFYDEPWMKTLAKFVFVSVTYSFVGAGTLLAILVVSLLTI